MIAGITNFFTTYQLGLPKTNSRPFPILPALLSATSSYCSIPLSNCTNLPLLNLNTTLLLTPPSSSPPPPLTLTLTSLFLIPIPIPRTPRKSPQTHPLHHRLHKNPIVRHN